MGPQASLMARLKGRKGKVGGTPGEEDPRTKGERYEGLRRFTWTGRPLDGAKKVGLPTDPDRLAKLAKNDLPRLAAVLVRVSLDKSLADAVRTT